MHIKKLYILLFAVFFLVKLNLIHAQAPSIQWQKNIGGALGDNAYSIQQTADGGYIVVGASNSNQADVSGNHGNSDFWVAKLSATGNITWQKSYGGSSVDVATSVQQTTDGGYIIAGYTDSQDGDVTGYHSGTQEGGPTFDFWVIKINSSGGLTWQKCLGGTLKDIAFSIHQTTDGGYIVAGETDSNDGDVNGYHPSPIFYFTTDFWVVKLTSSGAIQWDKAYGGVLYEVANSVIEASDGGYIVAGYTDSYDGLDVQGSHVVSGGAAYADFWVVKLSATGILQWQKCLGGSKEDVAFSIIQSADGGYVVVGHTVSNDGDVSGDHGPLDFWAVKLNNSGTIQWQKCYGGSSSEIPRDVKQTSDGGYIITGGTGSSDGDVSGFHGNEDFWLVKINNIGILEWQKCLGGTDYEESYSVNQTTDGGFVVAGASTSNEGDLTGNKGFTDYWIVKLGPPPCVPSIRIIASSTQFCAGALITFNSSITNGGTNPVYQWKINSINAGTNSGSFSTASLQDKDTIFCILTGTAPCLINPTIASDTIIVNVSNVVRPTITISTPNTTICAGSRIIFTAAIANGGTLPSFQWIKNGSNTGVDSTYYIDSTLNNGDIISCILTSNYPCVTSANAISENIIMKVNPVVSPSIIINASANNICVGTLVSYNALITNGGTSPTYQWKKNGTDVGTNSSVFSDNSIANGDIVTCFLTSNASCPTSSTALSNIIAMVVQINPVKVSLGPDISICKDTAILLKTRQGYASYLWQNGSTDSTLKVANPGTYYVQVNDLCGNISSDTIIITEFPNTADFLPNDTVICSYDTYILKPNGLFQSYLWSTNSISPSINVHFPGKYWLQVINNNNCISRDSILIGIKDCLQSFYIPNAFTPNNDFKNDTFKPILLGNVQRYEFTVFNRFGEIVFKTYDYRKGWDGKVKGKSVDMDVFVWYCVYQFNNEPLKKEKGSIILLK